MSFYLLQATYASNAWVYRVSDDPTGLSWPPDLASVFQAAGAKFVGLWYSFGEYEIAAIIEAPSNVDMMAIIVAASGGWDEKTFDAIKVTALMTPEEAVNATVVAAKVLPNSRDARWQ